MTFTEIQKIFEDKFGTNRLADMARELGVTPQVVSNWKSRNQVPYKYIKKLRGKIDDDVGKNKINIPFVPYDSIAVGNMSKENFANQSSDNVSIISLFSIFIKSIRKNIIYFFLIPTIFIGYTYFKATYIEKPFYTSTGKILPQANSAVSSKLSGLISQFGVSVPTKEMDVYSSEMFPDIIKSRNLNLALLYRKFDTVSSGREQPLIKIISGRVPTTSKDSLRLNSFGINRLRRMVRTITNKKNPLIRIQVVAYEPKLASDLAIAVIDELDKFQKRFKSKKIKEKRIFINNRMVEVEKELTIVEEKLKIFREQNKNRRSPSLLLQEERLVREVAVQTEIYITLKQEFELVQIEEVENSSMVTILDSPATPLNSSNPILLYRLIASFFFGVLVSFVFIIIKEWLTENWESKIKPMYK